MLQSRHFTPTKPQRTQYRSLWQRTATAFRSPEISRSNPLRDDTESNGPRLHSFALRLRICALETRPDERSPIPPIQAYHKRDESKSKLRSCSWLNKGAVATPQTHGRFSEEIVTNCRFMTLPRTSKIYNLANIARSVTSRPTINLHACQANEQLSFRHGYVQRPSRFTEVLSGPRRDASRNGFKSRNRPFRETCECA